MWATYQLDYEEINGGEPLKLLALVNLQNGATMHWCPNGNKWDLVLCISDIHVHLITNFELNVSAFYDIIFDIEKRIADNEYIPFPLYTNEFSLDS